MATIPRSPVPSLETVAFINLFPESEPIPAANLQLGAIYLGHGGNVAPIAQLCARDSAGRFAFTGYEVFSKGFQEITEILPLGQVSPGLPFSAFAPTRLIQAPPQTNTLSLTDQLVGAHLAYLQSKIQEVKARAHALEETPVYKQTLQGLQAQIELIRRTQAF